MIKPKELNYTELRNNDYNSLNFITTDEVEPFDGLIGQERATKALDFGLKIKSKGYNIYIAGEPGSGKTTFAQKYAGEMAKTEAIPCDWCYIYNFENPKVPLAINLTHGDGKEFADDMEELIELLSIEITKAFSTESYEKNKSFIVKKYQDKKDILMKEVSGKAKEHDFGVKYTNTGIYFLPVINGETITEEEYDQLPEDEKDKISVLSEIIQEKAEEVIRGIKDIEKSSKKDLEDLEYKTGLFAVAHHISALKEKHKKYEKIISYLNKVQEDILDNIWNFNEQESEEEDSLQSVIPWMSKKGSEDFTKYEVNLFVDNSKTIGAPVITDFNPTYYNLIGEIEYDNEFGNLITDFMKIKPGLLHIANGGYLILHVDDLLASLHAWEALFRTLKTEEIQIENLRELLGGIGVVTIKPEPIPLNIKVILVGSEYYYDVLSSYDENFQKFFKILADFDIEMNYDNENVSKLVSFIKAYSIEEKTLPFNSGAIIRILQEASRQAERNDKLTTTLSKIVEILAESNTWAQLANDTIVTQDHVNKAIYEKQQRVNMIEQKLSDMIEENFIMINTTGRQVGKINGLAVIQTESHTFAKPTCITANAYMGKAGIVNIEKEAELSGSIHDKGIQVLIGYMGSTYAQDFPLSLSCRICFEQNYNEIDGDSASCAELYAMLSALSNIPIDQELAITGSVNQKGEVQPIGGVTYKIEGFFDLCKSRGLTGTQGVVIPYQNTIDLVLKDEVIEAVRDGLFHIYPISNVNEGMEIMMHTLSGEKDDFGRFPQDTINGKVHSKLREYYIKQNSDVVKSSRAR